MFAKLYGRMKDQESLRSILDDLQEDFKKVEQVVSAEDRQLLEEHTTFVREMEQELKADASPEIGHAVPQLEPGVKEENDNIPRLSKLQIELMVSSFAADFARVATLQFTNSVGGARMHWLGIDEGHHHLSHEPDTNEDALDKLTRINKWYCEQLAYLAQRLAETPEPGGTGSLLDNTLIVWTNELGKGNSHTLDNIPFVLVGGGLDFRMGRSLDFKGTPAQPPAPLAGPRLRPPHQRIRQPELLRRWPAGRVGVARGSTSTECAAPIATEHPDDHPTDCSWRQFCEVDLRVVAQSSRRSRGSAICGSGLSRVRLLTSCVATC